MSDQLLQFLFDEAEARPLTVSELNAEVRGLVERRFSDVWVEGEVVNFMRAASGHWYFNLNDGTAQIKCVCWKGTNFRIRFRPENGVTVRIRGRVSFYEARGETQIVVESLEPSGEGALRAAFEQIRARLEGEGLFSEDLKRPIPFLPRRVGVVTSRTGAAFHDIVHMLTRRAPSVSIVLAPSLVQGEGSADSVRRALIALNHYNDGLSAADRIDVIIVGRGGGSAEDLWAFNDEALARAIRMSAIPVISAVGHEIDWTIADMIADLRAATPSAAAEIVAAREEDVFYTFRSGEERLVSLISRFLDETEARTRTAIDDLQGNFEWTVQHWRDRYADVTSRLRAETLTARSAAAAATISMLEQRRDSAVQKTVTSRNESLNVQMAKLNALSPLAVLTRGYSITQTDDGVVIRDAANVKKGDKLIIRVERGKLNAEVLSSE